jgi:cytochrome c5
MNFKQRFLPLAAVALIAPCVIGQTSQPQSAPSTSDVKKITLPAIPFPTLPDGPGRDVYMVQCGICHTQRYVTMQPRFSRKVWTDEVNKMINTYKAQIQPDQVNTIVDYLVSIRGTEGK